MTPVHRINDIREAVTTVLDGLQDLRQAVHALEAELLDWVEDAGDVITEAAHQPQPQSPAPEAPTPPAAEKTTDPAPAPVPDTPDLAAVRAILGALARDGHTAEVKQLLTDMGVSRLSDLPADQYPALLDKAERIPA
ncbi:hypothetical protein [Corynebacterium urealyticum]|uniref:hypothetical protein n=1 Tax=Corynebacterium urealyticum TaxID=43771 RepID=UPI0011E68930|nr:hypothetical protein [Corynebacterium urealyticum]TYR15604.1 hypothetical protein FYJ89_03490 [Corynebacterium urealyticum]TYR17940.1 hypothetical protein FYJ88_03690 [Corynebacterium urealyticum]